jgi:hypothetical protein
MNLPNFLDSLLNMYFSIEDGREESFGSSFNEFINTMMKNLKENKLTDVI